MSLGMNQLFTVFTSLTGALSEEPEANVNTANVWKLLTVVVSHAIRVGQEAGKKVT